MSKTLVLYVLRTFLAFFAGIYAAMLAVYLVVDFVDRAHIYNGPHWVTDAALLYGYKAIVVSQQLGPAVLLLAASTAVSTMRKRGEMTAMRALSFGPTSLYLPIGAGALAIAFLMVGFDEYVVLGASKRADEIQTQRFDAWGDWRFYFQPKQWFRRGNHILFLRQGNVDSGFEDITVLEVSPTFELTRRWDARRMEHVVGTRWKLFDVSERRLEESRRRLITLPELVLDLKVGKDKLRIRSGRPEQMPWSELREQIRARRTVGLPTGPFSLAMHNRFAYPISGAFAAVVAVGLATRKNRRGHLTTAILEGLAVAMCLWGFMVVARTLVLTDRIPAAIAAWTPILAIAITASRLWMRDELRA